MNHCKSILVALLLSILNHPSTLFAQGSLTPPGAPAPTMKSLDQIEPRIPISTLPFSISNGGSYYLTGSLTGGPGQDGITVTADNVTIDLNGFELAGVPAHSGIAGSGTHTNIVVRNGTIRDWSLGVSTLNTTGGRFERLQFIRDTSGGLYVGDDSLILECTVEKSPSSSTIFGSITTGSASVVRNCIVKNSASIGIQVGSYSSVSGCTVMVSAGVGISPNQGSIVSGCVVTSASGVAIYCSQNTSVLDCSVSGNQSSGIIAGNGCTIRNCVADNNVGIGIGLFDASTIQNCAARQNGNGGISLGTSSTISDCITFSNTANGIIAGTFTIVTHCSSTGNSSNGIVTSDGCSIKDCTVNQNLASGIRTTSNCLIAGNVASLNATGLTNQANIYVTATDNQIMDNTVTGGGPGIKTTSGFNLIVKNKVTLSIPPFDLALNNKTGSITNDPTLAGPWANFNF